MPPSPKRLLRPRDIGPLIAAGRRRGGHSQASFAARIGISRKTLSDIERGVAEHVSLNTALQALALSGFVLEASVRQAPTLEEIMAERAEHQGRIDRLSAPPPPAKGKRPRR